ncbi:MAG: DUF1801 domain-containing protein [Oscillospiraceae bacterium]|nr:DUF1801 domain-containing protein [Oscillospiraceae bacterium]
MNEQIKIHLKKYPENVVILFEILRRLIYESVDCDISETLWAKIPSYYVGDAFVRLIPFKDHINVEAQGITAHKDELSGYKITPKGMLQIFVNEEVPADVLKKIFKETLV